MLLNIWACCCTFARNPGTPAYSKSQPLLFIENVGQVTDQHRKPRKDVHFRVQNESFSVLLSNKGIHYQWSEAEGIDKEDLRNNEHFKVKQYRMDVELVGADLNAKVIAEGQASYHERYYLGHLGLNGETARGFEKVTYQNVYPGIDWVLYTSKGKDGRSQLKYDFVVRPGADLNKIKLKYKGASSLKINKDGSFSATTPMGSVTEDAPYAYVLPTNEHGQKQVVPSKYALNDNVLSFSAESYSGTLVIDPALEWGTYYGGVGFDLGTVLACDFAGNVYLTGASWMSANIATTGSHQSVSGGDFDAFFAKFDANGNRVWATFFGGAGGDYSMGLVCDINNRIFISGTTSSSGSMSTPGSHQPVYGGATDNYLARFDSSGVLMWSTYYGSSANESGGICTVDDDGHVYLAGYTSGNNNIASGGHQNTYAGGINDAYLAKFDTSGNRIWATYYGGSGHDEADGISCDLFGNVYLAGNTNSPDNIATPGSHQPAIGGMYDNFLVKFDAAGVRQWATYYGGTLNEFNGYMRTVVTDKTGNVYVCGHTQSTTGIATAGSHQDTLAGNYDAYLVKFNGSGVRDWGTYFGGNLEENGGAIAIDFSGNIFWSGYTSSSSGIATADAHQSTYGGGLRDAFLARFTNTGVQEYGTYYGGSDLDEGYAVGFDYVGNAYISGGTTSANGIATPNSFSTVFGGGIAIYLAKFCTSVAATDISGPDTLCANSVATFFAAPLSGATDYIWDIPAGWSGSSDSASITVQTDGTGGTVTVRVVRCDTSAPQNLEVYVWPAATAAINNNNNVLSTQSTHDAYQWLRDGSVIAGATNPTYTVTENGSYAVAVTNSPDCKDTSDVVVITGLSVGAAGGVGIDIDIYPNPSEGKIYIKTDIAYTVSVLSIDGKVHIERSNAKELDINELSSGLYLLEFRGREGQLLTVKKVTRR